MTCPELDETNTSAISIRQEQASREEVNRKEARRIRATVEATVKGPSDSHEGYHASKEQLIEWGWADDEAAKFVATRERLEAVGASCQLPPPRKVIQIVSAAPNDLTALCDDGSMWEWGITSANAYGWNRLADVPQD